MALNGTYKLDLRKTAELRTADFRDRFVMPAGYEQAVRQFMADNADIEAATSLEIGEQSLTLTTEDGRESFPITARGSKKGQTYLDLDWYGDPERVVVEDAGDGAIRLRSAGEEGNELEEYVWRRAEG